MSFYFLWVLLHLICHRLCTGCVQLYMYLIFGSEKKTKYWFYSFSDLSFYSIKASALYLQQNSASIQNFHQVHLHSVKCCNYLKKNAFFLNYLRIYFSLRNVISKYSSALRIIKEKNSGIFLPGLHNLANYMCIV